MKCSNFIAVITVFFAFILKYDQTKHPEYNNQMTNQLTPDQYGKYETQIINFIIDANKEAIPFNSETGKPQPNSDATQLRANMAQWEALNAGASAMHFYDTEGHILYDIVPYGIQSNDREVVTLWGELMGLWQTINNTFGNANFPSKILTLMQFIGIIKCAKWCVDTACCMVSGAFNFGTMSAKLFKDWLTNSSFDTTKTPLPLQDHVNKLIDELGDKPTNELIDLNKVSTDVLKLLIDNPPRVSNTDSRFITQEKKESDLSDDEHVALWKKHENMKLSSQPNPIIPRPGVKYFGGRRSKSKRRRNKNKSSKRKSKRRRHKTKKRVYRSTRFRSRK